MIRPTALSGGRLDVLDGLRGIAVLMVLWYHVWETTWLPSFSWYTFIPATGFVGVHLFFFISGFVIAYPFVRAKWAGAPNPTWAHFANRRFFKIVPSYVLSIAVAYAIGYAQTQTQTLGASALTDLGTHLLFVHTWFANTNGSINGVLWTLGVEIEFYLMFPLIWWCFKHSPWLTTTCMILIALAWRNALLACCLSTSFALWEENLPGYLDVFALGMLSVYVYVRFGDRLRVSPASRTGAVVVALLGVAYALSLLHGMYDVRAVDQWSGIWQVNRRPLFGLAFAAVALGSLTAPPLWRRLIANRALVFMGVISYNLYLYNQIVGRELLWHHVPTWVGKDPHFDPHWQLAYTIVASAASIALATVLTFGLEQPILRAGARFSRPQPVVAEGRAASRL